MRRTRRRIQWLQLVSLPATVWVMTAASFLNDTSSEMLATLLPLFLTDVLGAGTAVVGLIEGCAEATASLLKVASGWSSDRSGRRKPLAVAGYLLSAASRPFLLSAGSWPCILAVRICDRVGKGIRTAPRDALMADAVVGPRRGLAFGIHRAGDTLGALAGLSIALVLVLKTPRGPTALSGPTFGRLALLSIVPAALAIIGLMVGVRESPGACRRHTTSARPAARLDGRFMRFILIVAVFTLGNSSDAFLILRARQVGLSVPGVMGMMITFNLVFTLVSGPAGGLSDLWGRRTLILGGWMTYVLIYLGFAHVQSGWQAWTLMTVYGLYHGMTQGVIKAFVADLVPAELRGTAYGILHGAIGLAALPASLIAGLLWQGAWGWEGFGAGAPFYFGSAMAAIASLMMLTMMPSGSVGDRSPCCRAQDDPRSYSGTGSGATEETWIGAPVAGGYG